MHSLIRLVVAGVAVACCPYVSAQSSITEELIRREVIRLGGEWEGGKYPVRIGFSGEKFAERHFEMLEHVRNTKMLTVSDIDIGPIAIASISKLKAIKFIQIQGGSLSGNGSRKLRRLGSLESLEIHECTLDAKVVRSIGGIVSLKRLLLIDVELPSDTIKILSELPDLEHLQIATPRVFSREDINALKAKLPKCAVDILRSAQ